MAQDILNGDLPADITILSDTGSVASDEGREMAQLIHLMVRHGVKVVVDDVEFLDEPFWQPGDMRDEAAPTTSACSVFDPGAARSFRVGPHGFLVPDQEFELDIPGALTLRAQTDRSMFILPKATPRSNIGTLVFLHAAVAFDAGAGWIGFLQTQPDLRRSAIDAAGSAGTGASRCQEMLERRAGYGISVPSSNPPVRPTCGTP